MTIPKSLIKRNWASIAAWSDKVFTFSSSNPFLEKLLLNLILEYVGQKAEDEQIRKAHEIEDSVIYSCAYLSAILSYFTFYDSAAHGTLSCGGNCA